MGHVERSLSPETRKSLKMITCPSCGRKFSLMYSRAIACWGCPNSVGPCPYVRCPYCDTEMRLEHVFGKRDANRLSTYLGKVIREYEDGFG